MKLALPQLFFRFWWITVFAIVCYGVYLHGMQKKRSALATLMEKCHYLEKELIAATSEREDLLLVLASESDPAWCEMMLKKRLGMVPEGQTKVYFEK
jgi:hypothetical protein